MPGTINKFIGSIFIKITHKDFVFYFFSYSLLFMINYIIIDTTLMPCIAPPRNVHYGKHMFHVEQTPSTFKKEL